MLQTDNASNPPQLVLFSQQEAPNASSPAPCPVSGQFLKVFESMTGWRPEFLESEESSKRRQIASLENEPRAGNFKIVDMSEDWPARTPTVHREKCDQLIGLFDTLMKELHATRTDLFRAHSALEALCPGSVCEEVELVDAFVPKFSNGLLDQVVHSRRSTDSPNENLESDPDDAQFLYESHYVEEPADAFEAVDDFELVKLEEDDLGDHDFVVHQEVSGIHRGPQEPWKQYCVGGSSGISTDVYLDWFLDGDNLFVYVGRLQSSHGNGDAEVAIEIDPNENRYRVTGEASLEAFHIFDRRGGEMTAADSSGQWANLPPGGAVFASTCEQLQAPDPHADITADPSAEQLAKVLGRNLPEEEKIMVIKRLR